MEIFMSATTSAIDYEESAWQKISKEAKAFLKLMLVRDPRKRASASDLLKHDWIVKNMRN